MNKFQEARDEVNAEIVVINDERNAEIKAINDKFDSQLAEKQIELKFIDKYEAKLTADEPIEEVAVAEVTEVNPAEAL